MSKKLIPAIIVIAVLVLGFLLFKPSANDEVATPTPTPAPGASPIDTTNWKTYRNEQYGFEVKYPSYWYLTARNPVGEPYSNLPAGPITFTNYDLSTLKTPFPQIPSWVKIDIYIAIKSQNWSLESSAKEDFLSPQRIKVSELDAIQGIRKPSEGEGGPPLQVFSTVFVKDNLVFSIGMIGDMGEQKDFYNRIVQSLKFI